MKILNYFVFSMAILSLAMLTSCGDDDEPGGGTTTDAPIASFQFAVDDLDFATVNFSNFSQNADTYAWEFGDGGTSSDENPTYTYAAGGDYTVSLTASSGDQSASTSKTVTITDPNEAAALLTGGSSKTWKLFREGVCMSVGPNADDPAGFWPGLSNDGSRPCLYGQEITFGADGSYTFNDNGMFWAEYGLFNNVAGCDQNTDEQCFEATAANMVNACGDNVSAWLSGTHAFAYEASTSTLTLTGEGAWIGIPKLGTTGEVITPQSSVSARVTIEEFTGYDVMLVEFDYGGVYWPIRYASYSDASLEPEIQTENVVEPFGEDLADIAPTQLFRGFASADASDFMLLDTIFSGSTIDYGVADPAGGADNVGQFNRTAAQYQELQFQTSPEKNDIDFSNMTTVSLDVYLPSTNDYSGALTTNIIVGLGDRSATEQWWTDNMEYINDGTGIALDTWTTLTWNLDSPDYAANGGTPFDRTDFDMIYIQIGSGNHTEVGTFYVRNLDFQ